MNTVIMQYQNSTAFWNRMNALGLSNKDAEDNLVKRQEDRAGRCLTPPLVCSDGSMVVRVLMTPEDAAKMPPENNPSFALVWDSSDLEEVEIDGELVMQVKEEPLFGVDTYDEDGNVLGTRMASVPKIAGY